MKKNIFILATLLLSISFSFACDEHASTAVGKKTKNRSLASAATHKEGFGKAITINSAPMKLSEAVAKIQENKNKEILVKGKIVDVCQQKGCWMKIKDGNTLVRITFENYGFFVPKNSKNKEALLQGKLIEKEMSVGAAKHYAKDEGKSKKEIDAIKATVKTLEFVASGVELM